MNSMTSRPKNAPSSKLGNSRGVTKPGKRPPGRNSPPRRPSVPARVRNAKKAADFPWWDPESQIERATELVPLWVAEDVLNEAGTWLGTALPAEWPAILAAKAERCFARHRQFHRLVSAPAAGIANLRKFLRHWLSGLLLRTSPALYRRLPASFTLGVPIG